METTSANLMSSHATMLEERGVYAFNYARECLTIQTSAMIVIGAGAAS